MHCNLCKKKAVYICATCGKLVCSEHAQLRTMCPSCIRRKRLAYRIVKASEKDKRQIGELVKRFWGEPEQVAFGKRFIVEEMPAFVAKSEDRVVGFISFTESDDELLIVALGVLPTHQGAGIGRKLVMTIENAVKKHSKKRILVATSNDDLPALAFYQSLGFQIFEVVPNVIAEKHGCIVSGIGGLPVRDELRLQKTIVLDADP